MSNGKFYFVPQSILQGCIFWIVSMMRYWYLCPATLSIMWYHTLQNDLGNYSLAAYTYVSSFTFCFLAICYSTWYLARAQNIEFLFWYNVDVTSKSDVTFAFNNIVRLSVIDHQFREYRIKMVDINKHIMVDGNKWLSNIQR